MDSRVLTLCFVVLCACGGAPHRDLDDTFARIQVEEARIEHAATARDAHEECVMRAGACDEICDATSALCELARESEDRDALARCERAEARCRACGAEPACEEPPS
ncbi:hypothetical protein DB32_004197 [Sandaracinus amylolyticus]|uniref:Uncharacterized protein n=1 Tax=Sandaracinus amylolyticus TaxID=927083 RepID=A0A0F6W4A5_9BACT|nr:hypothetical protein DB32_004197 [Sandaracinus amylolyticus]